MKVIRANQKLVVDDNLRKWLTEGEEVRIIDIAPHYAITNTGRIFSGKDFLEYEYIDGEKKCIVAWNELFPHIVRGYWAINLSIKGKVKKYYIHDLLYRAFKGEYSKYYFKVIYIDGCRDNLHIDNLEIKFKSKRKEEEFIYRTPFRKNLKKYESTPINF